VLERLPKLGSGRLPAWIVILPIALAVLSFTWFDEEWNLAFFNSYAIAILLLSVVVLTGFAGQISLVQMALAGLAALIAGRMIEDHDLPFVLALVIGVAAALAIGLVFALPALRTRGINLAVTTLGLGLAVQAMIFSQGKYTGGAANGIRVGELSFFGLKVDRTDHPERYAVFTLCWLVLVAMVVLNVRRGRAGRRLIAIRTNERAAASLGVSIFGAKLYAFALASTIAGLGGILLAFKDRTLAIENTFSPFSSINIVVLAVIGGIAYVLGPIMGMQLAMGGIGALITTRIGVDDNWIVLVGGLILLIQVVLIPDGMASHMSEAIDRSARKRAAEAQQVPDEVPVVRVEPAELSVSGISVRLGSIYAVSEASLEVHPGEVVGLIGPNGAGKTTFIDAVTGFVRTTQGKVLLNGQDITWVPPARRKRAGLSRTFQSLELFDDLTVRDNLLAGADDLGIKPYFTDLFWPRKEQLPPTALRAIKDLELDDVLDTPAGDLPYGQRRLVSIARALAGTPSILMLDEPAAGLSDAETGELRHLIRRLAEEWGIGVLLVEHDMSLVMAVCDRIVALEAGQVIAEGRPEEIARDARVRAAYLGDEATVPDGDIGATTTA
jgi:sulfate-transporting ATPase